MGLDHKPISFDNVKSSLDLVLDACDEDYDVEALLQTAHGLASPYDPSSRSLFNHLESLPLLQRFLNYPAPNSLKLKPTSWLDGVRGVAALEVYIFHTISCWITIVPAWHSDILSTSTLQLPLIRTFFVAGGAAVAVFFALSGYVLTYKSLRWIRAGTKQHVYPSVASSMFRRGFRLYLPPILLTFCEMLATRFGYAPPLNFSFVPEISFAAQFADWLGETNKLINPVYNFIPSLQGYVIHPKYDPVIWTIPLEFYGSFICYTLLLLLVKVPTNTARMALISTFSGFSMLLGSWNAFCFSAGMLIADFNLEQEENNTTPLIYPSRHSPIYLAIFAAAMYIAGFPTLVYPDVKASPMPGFETLRALIPMGLHMEDHARFWWSISGVSILFCTSQLPQLKSIFETNICQYLGKIAFSLYLVHQFCVMLFGFAMQRALLGFAGLESHANTLGYWVLCLIWYVSFTALVFALAAQVEKYVDAPSVRFARWLEGKCLKSYRSIS